MGRIFLVSGPLISGLAVAAGAFGSHVLRSQLSDTALASFDTASRYQLFHGLTILLIGYFLTQKPSITLYRAGWCFLGGIVLFSGSLYILALTNLKVLGVITPIGGIGFLVGWSLLAWWGLKEAT